MSAEAQSHLFGPQGPVNTGTGHQFIGPTFILNALQQLVRVGPDLRTVAREHLHWLHPRFVEPDPFGRAQELLADHRSVLLTGAEGSGRRAAAQMLLHRLPGAEVQIRELPDGDPDKPELNSDEVDSGQRLLLDLSTSKETFCAEVLEQLPSYRNAVRDHDAHLVVVLPRSREHYFGAEFGSSIVDIVKPKGEEVFRRYLRCDDITRDARLDDGELAEQLRSEPMSRIAELARLVQLAKDSAPQQGFLPWLGEAHKAWIERSAEVAAKVKKLRSGQLRALLLTTAMFHGAHADTIFTSASQLRTLDQHPTDERPRLEQEGLAEQLAKIGAKKDTAGRVRFMPLAYDRAVRTHFWNDYPDRRETFREWVGIALKHPTLSSEDRDAVVTRFAQQALRTGRPDDLRLLAERWVRRTDPRWPSRLLPQAATAVGYGLNDERHARFFRQRLYDWSRDRNLSPDLAQVVVQVCSEVLALTRPKEALVRLHHLVRRHPGAAGEAARGALLNLIEGDRRLYRRLLDRVTDGLTTPENAATDLDLFLELADPDRLTRSSQRRAPLIADALVRDRLSTSWRSALGGLFSPGCAHRVRTWLTAAGENERYREHVLTVLVKAGDGRNDLLSRLYVVARNWAHAPEGCPQERIGITDLVNDMIDSAQGIDFTKPDLPDRTEGTSP
ncbi:MAG: hypothetical protein JO115_11950 [Pseudonocardiales bacterium]|nr:hypothetical protein [Pseudonocardiales bacterium]